MSALVESRSVPQCAPACAADPIEEIMRTPPKSRSQFMGHYQIGHTKFWLLVKGGTLDVFRVGNATLVTPQSERRYIESLVSAQHKLTAGLTAA